MEITVKLDDLLYARLMTLTELADKVDTNLANLDPGRHLRRAGLPAGRYSGF